MQRELDPQWTVGSLVLYDFGHGKEKDDIGEAVAIIVEIPDEEDDCYDLKPLFSTHVIRRRGLKFRKKLAQLKLGEDQTILGVEGAGPFEVAPDPRADV